MSKVKMSAEARVLFEKLQSRVIAINSEILELAESNSVSSHGPAFFLEVLPRRYKLTLLLALDFNEVEDPSGRVHDATQWKFFVYAKHEAGVHLRVEDEGAIEASIPFIRQAYEASCK